VAGTGTPPDQSLARGRSLAARGALWLLLGSWGAKGAQTLMLLVLAKILAPAQFGILAIAALTYNVLAALNQLGAGDALTYLPDRDVGKASRTALTMLTGTGVLLMALTWALSPVIAHFFHSPGATLVLKGFALGIPFDAAAQVPIALMTRNLQFARRTVTDTVPTLIGTAVTIGVVLAGHPLPGLVAGQVAGAVARAVVAMAIGPRYLPGWNTAMMRKLLSYGGYLSAADMLNFGLLNVDYIIVGHVLGPVALGYYSLAYRICFMPYLSISVVANGAVFPYYCRLPTREATARTAEGTLSLINAVSMPWFAGLVLFAGDIALLGGKWAPAVGAVRFLAVYGFFLSVILSALQILKAVGRTDLVFFGRGCHLAVLTAVLILTVRGGITVVALDQAVVAAGIAVVTGYWTIRHASLRAGAVSRSVALPLVGALGMVPVVLLLGRIPGLDAVPSWTALLVLGPLALAAFAVIILVIMPDPLRKGWAALRARPGPATGGPARHGPAGDGVSMDGPAPGGALIRAGPAATGGLPRPAGIRDPRSLAAGALVLAVAAGAAFAVGHWPLPAVAGFAAAGLVAVLLCRLDIAVALLAAGFYFNNYLARGAGLVTIDKVIGGLAVSAWILEWALNRRPILRTRQLWLLVGFLLWTMVSVTVAVADKAALVTSLRYIIFVTLYFLVLQTVRGDRRRADVLVHVVVAAAAIASLIGLIAFLRHHVVQASGPLKDPNDFGFILASTIPLAIYEVRWSARRGARALWGLALILILVCTFATFSRSALTGLALACVWAVVTGRLRLRWVLGAAACLAVAVLVALQVTPHIVTGALHERAHVAAANVNIRIGYYRVEISEWEHHPLTGVGPGNFVYRFYQYAPGAKESLPFPSNVLTVSGEEAYLVILAEQGTPGLLLFLGYLALSWADLRRRWPGHERDDQLQAALAAGFIVACVGALFLAEQYYPPLWFLPAIGASLAAGRRLRAPGPGTDGAGSGPPGPAPVPVTAAAVGGNGAGGNRAGGNGAVLAGGGTGRLTAGGPR
jgi:O-antigen/teichoic acid export membrane protein/O-antigen ligase